MELCWEEIGTRKLTAEWIVKYGGGHGARWEEEIVPGEIWPVGEIDTDPAT